MDTPRRLIILLVANTAPNYHNVISPSPEGQTALYGLLVPPILGSVGIAVLIGGVPYVSSIAYNVEYLPLVADVVGASWTDLQLTIKA